MTYDEDFRSCHTLASPTMSSCPPVVWAHPGTCSACKCVAYGGRDGSGGRIGELEWVSRVYLCSKNRMDVWRTATSGRVTSAHARNHVFDDRWRHLQRVHLLPRTWKKGVGRAWKHGDLYVCSGMLRNGHTHTNTQVRTHIQTDTNIQYISP